MKNIPMPVSDFFAIVTLMLLVSELDVIKSDFKSLHNFPFLQNGKKKENFPIFLKGKILFNSLQTRPYFPAV